MNRMRRSALREMIVATGIAGTPEEIEACIDGYAATSAALDLLYDVELSTGDGEMYLESRDSPSSQGWPAVKHS